MPKQIGLDVLDKALVRYRFMHPNATAEECGKALGVSGPAAAKRFRKPDALALLEKMHCDIYQQAISIREQALRNAADYVKRPESKEGFEMTKMFAQAVAENPSTMPDAPIEAPEFFDPDAEDKS